MSGTPTDPSLHRYYPGFVPIIFLFLGSGVGQLVFAGFSSPGWLVAVGGLVGAVIGYLASRSALRAYLRRRMTPESALRMRTFADRAQPTGSEPRA